MAPSTSSRRREGGQGAAAAAPRGMPSTSTTSTDGVVYSSGSSRRATKSTGSGTVMGLATVALLALSGMQPASVQAQDLTSNITSLTGTWSSGSGSVLTGPGFAQPTNFTFTYPNNTGIALSFTDDGYFEEAQYRFESNGTEPHCVQAVVIWQHGNYTIQPNGSITTSPISTDGRIQVQDPCASETNVITYYDQPSVYNGWAITNDVNHNRYMLQLTKFDGSLMPRLYLWYRPPTMLPTEQLWTSAAYKAFEGQKGGAGRRRSVGGGTAGAIVLTTLTGLVGLTWSLLA